MDTGAEPYQSADVLIDLRNALVHFTPQWWHDDGTGEAKFVAALRGKLAGRENRQPIGEPWYPNKVLGAGCADWACGSAIAFARDWHGRMGLTHDFDQRYLMPSEPVEVDEQYGPRPVPLPSKTAGTGPRPGCPAAAKLAAIGGR